MPFPTPATKTNCDAITDDPKQALLTDLATLIDKFNTLLSECSTALLARADAYNYSFPAGTRMLFQQTSAPTGWTKDTTAALNDSALRIVTGAVGSGGSVAFSSASYTPTISGATAAYTLTTTDIPSHNHSTMPIHAAIGGSSAVKWVQALEPGASGGWGLYSNTTGSTGGGGAHSHSAGTLAVSAVTLNLKYNDVIICTKN